MHYLYGRVLEDNSEEINGFNKLLWIGLDIISVYVYYVQSNSMPQLPACYWPCHIAFGPWELACSTKLWGFMEGGEVRALHRTNACIRQSYQCTVIYRGAVFLKPRAKKAAWFRIRSNMLYCRIGRMPCSTLPKTHIPALNEWASLRLSRDIKVGVA